MCNCCPCQRAPAKPEITDADLSPEQREQIAKAASDGRQTGLEWPAAHKWFQYEPGGPWVYEYRNGFGRNPQRERELKLIAYASGRAHSEWKQAFRAAREEVKAGRSKLWTYEEWLAARFPEQAAA